MIWFHIKFVDDNILLIRFPIKIWLFDNAVVPIPPRETVKVPNETLEAFKLLSWEPSPLIPFKQYTVPWNCVYIALDIALSVLFK